MAGAVAVLGPAGQVCAADRLTGADALYRGRVDHPHVVGPHAGVAGKCPQQPVQRGGEAAKPLVVAGLLGQVGEQVAGRGTGGAGARLRTVATGPHWCAPTMPASPPASPSRRRRSSGRYLPRAAMAIGADGSLSKSSVRTYSAVCSLG